MIGPAVSNTYRDDREAAHALAEALQRENAELRSELARAKEGDFGSTFAPPPTVAAPPPGGDHASRSLTVLMSVMILAFGAVGTAVALHPTRITVVAPPPEAPAIPPPLHIEEHTPSTGRFIPHPPRAHSYFPEQRDVFMAFQSARPDVARCFREDRRYTTATIEFTGDGAVSDVRFMPSSPDDGCMEAAIRRIRLPNFLAPTWTVVQSFSVLYRR